VEKSWPKIRATAAFFKSLLKVNNRPKGVNSPNLVALMRDEKAARYEQTLDGSFHPITL
jgi:hypothetical protein